MTRVGRLLRGAAGLLIAFLILRVGIELTIGGPFTQLVIFVTFLSIAMAVGTRVAGGAST